MLQSYKTITIDVEIDKKAVPVEIPFTVELLHRVEEAIQRMEGTFWFKIYKSEKSRLDAYDWFAKEYLPAELDLTQVPPTFTALFFRLSETRW